jgi:ABC-type multidrug transport system fused ATPase/permease subunit
MFLNSSLLAIIVASLNFNSSVIIRDAFTPRSIKTVFNEIGDNIKNLKNEEKVKVRDILNLLDNTPSEIGDKKKDELSNSLKKIKNKLEGRRDEEISKEEVDDLAREIENLDKLEQNFFTYKEYRFSINIFGYELFKDKRFNIKDFALCALVFLVFFKSFSSLYHYYCMHYAYESIEKNLKKDLFNNFIKSEYVFGSQVAPSLIAQFANDLGLIVDHI